MFIHQTWKSKRVPKRHRDWVKSWKSKNPGWKHRIWTDEDNRELIRDRFPQILPVYDAYTKEIFRTDIARLAYMHAHGGVYADLDMECLVPLSKSIPKLKKMASVAQMPGSGTLPGVLLAYEPKVQCDIYKGMTGIKHSLVCNAMMVSSKPGHPFWLWCLMQAKVFAEHILETKGDLDIDPVMLTGPSFMGLCLKGWNQGGWKRLSAEKASRVGTVPTEMWYPIVDIKNASIPIGARRESWKAIRDRRFGKAHAVHYWAGTWYNGAHAEQFAIEAGKASGGAGADEPSSKSYLGLATVAALGIMAALILLGLKFFRAKPAANRALLPPPAL